MLKLKVPVYVWRAVTIAYMAALMFVSLIPKVLPGPSTPLKENIHNSLHIPAYAVLMFLVWHSLRKSSLVMAGCAAFAYGALNEFLQMFDPQRTASLSDVGRNAIGVGIMMFFISRWMVLPKKTGGLA